MEMWMRILVFAIVITGSMQRSIRDAEDVNATKLENYDTTSFSIEQLSDANCSCNWRFLGHYEAKGCKPLEENECGCPVKFECPNVNEIERNYKVCLHKGIEYAVDTVINTTNPCQVCRCSGGSTVKIVCSHVECPQLMGPLEPNCHLVYEKNRCCPVKTDCSNTEIGDESQAPKITCEYNGQIYPHGARIYPEDDPCQICVCAENWNGTSNSNCFYQDCIFERNKSKLQQGCIPIYHEKTCCPIEFYCSSENEFISKDDATELELSENDSKCIFEGQSYEVGKTLSINHATNCVSCTCLIPPDFTCIHQSCPPAPTEETCYPFYSPDRCCPQYECALGDDSEITNFTNPTDETLEKREMEGNGTVAIRPLNSENPCAETHCSEDRECVLYQVMCGNVTCPPVPTCLKINASCPTPQCAPGCVATEHDESNCPTCICGKDIEKRASNARCKLPQCVGQNCHLVAGDDGCPICSCDQPCSILECPPGCNVLSEREGLCPECVCEDETEGCPTPICENESCSIETPIGASCPTCICGDLELCPTPICENENCQIGRSKGGCLRCFCATQVNENPVNETVQQPHVQQQLSGESESSFLPENLENNDYDAISIMSERSIQNTSSDNEKLVETEMNDMSDRDGDQESTEKFTTSHISDSMFGSEEEPKYENSYTEHRENLSFEKPLTESTLQKETSINRNAIDNQNADEETTVNFNLESDESSSTTETININTDVDYTEQNLTQNSVIANNNTEADKPAKNTSLNTDEKIINGNMPISTSTCFPIQCKGYDCHVVKEGNCHVCICKTKCPPPICNSNCEVQDNGENECPSCVCHIPITGIRPEP